ncbi:MAG: hypothetical protein LBG31_00555 [Prevotellaceae bacterium]|jgi:hypothetical protein|nr:hypothetical protein [Prevotellaceae bacterium]
MESTTKNPASKLPEQVIIPGIMEFIRAEKERISLETYDMTTEEVMEYFKNSREEFLAAFHAAQDA